MRLIDLNERCWDDYKQVGMKKKGDRMVPNCVPVNEEIDYCVNCGELIIPEAYQGGLRKWFKQKWVNIAKKDGGKHPECGTSGKDKGYAKCVPAAKARSMSKAEKKSAVSRKRAAQTKAGRGGKDRPGSGKDPIRVSTESQIDEKWSEKYKSSIDCNNPKGFSQRAHCAGKKKK